MTSQAVQVSSSSTSMMIPECCLLFEGSRGSSSSGSGTTPMMTESATTSSYCPLHGNNATYMNFIIVLINAGVSNNNLCQHVRALECYSQALYKLEMEEECFQMQEDQRHAVPSWRTTTASDSNNNNSRQQSLEYDEGMFVYNRPIKLPTSLPATPPDSSSSASPLHVTSEELIPSILCYNVAHTHSCAGHYETAKRWFERSLQRSSRADADHTVKVLHNLGYCSYRLGDCNRAIEYCHQALSLILEVGMGGSSLAAALNCLGVLIFRSQESDKADLSLELFQQSLKTYKSMLSSESSSDNGSVLSAIATVLNNIGRVHYRSNDYHQALPHYEESLQLRQQVLGFDSIDTAATSFNMGQALQKSGDLDGAMRCYMEFVRILRSLGASESADIALALRAIAEIYRERNDFKSSYQFLLQALQAQRSSLGNMHHQVAQTLNMLGNLCYEMQDYSSALKYYKEGLEVEENVLDSDHPHIVVTWNNIALIQKLMGLYEDALTSYRNVYLLQVEVEEGAMARPLSS